MRLQYILFIAFVFAFVFADANKAVLIKTVVIDAGHGGKDPGASSKSGKIHEKDVALTVALKLGSYIEKNFPEVNVIYTRKTDVFLELHERAEIANKAKADLFIAIHCNASTNEDIYGTSTYVLGLHRTEANLEVAKRENSVILLEDDRDKNYEFDPNTPEGHIIMSMKQNAFLDQSIDFASKTEHEFGTYSKRKSLGVKQAGFYVLYKTAMPSLLCEIGFISNPEEEKFLVSPKGQELVATGLSNAFGGYKEQMEGSPAVDKTSEEEPKPTTPVAAQEPEKKTTATEEKKEEPVAEHKTTTATPKRETPAPAKTEQPEVSNTNSKSIRKPIENASGGGVAKATAKPAEVKPVAKVEPATVAPKEPVKSKPETTTVSAEPKKKPEEKAEPKPAAPVVKEEKATTTEAEPKKKPEVKPELKKEEPAVVKVKPAPAVKEVQTGSSTSMPAHTAESGTVFKVQLFALKGDMKERDYAKVTKLFSVFSAELLPNGFTRYYAGNLKAFVGAKKLLTIALDNGFSSAFIVGFKEGKRMSTEQVLALDK